MFTKVLLDAFNDRRADINNDHLINPYGLANYLRTQIIALTDGAQHPESAVRYGETLFASVP